MGGKKPVDNLYMGIAGNPHVTITIPLEGVEKMDVKTSMVEARTRFAEQGATKVAFFPKKKEHATYTLRDKYPA